MNYESATQVAKRLGVTPRTVQKWAAAGKISGAVLIGNSWAIPADFTEVAPKVRDNKRRKKNKDVSAEDKELSEKIKKLEFETGRIPLPLLNGSFEIGSCLEFINTIPHIDDRNIALGEYYYYTGRPEEALSIMEKYLNHEDHIVKYSAGFICTFANLSCGRLDMTQVSVNRVLEELKKGLIDEKSPEKHSMSVLTATTVSVLLHINDHEIPSLESYLKYLPTGLKLWGCYVLAYKAYQMGHYYEALSISEIALAISPRMYPIPEMYCRLINIMTLMQQKRVEEAETRFLEVWDMAKQDDFIGPLGEHHSLLHGLIERNFKYDMPKDYKRIIEVKNKFADGWRRMQNPDYEKTTGNLTHMEFVIAMLFARGWTTKEIAEHLEISKRTVSNYMSSVYNTLGGD